MSKLHESRPTCARMKETERKKLSGMLLIVSTLAFIVVMLSSSLFPANPIPPCLAFANPAIQDKEVIFEDHSLPFSHSDVDSSTISSVNMNMSSHATSENLTSEGDWPTFYHDSARKGYVEKALNPPLKSLWSHDFKGFEYTTPSPPIVADGRVYFSAVAARAEERYVEILDVCALDIDTGAFLWNYSIRNPDIYEFGASPVLTASEGVVYFGTMSPRSLEGYDLYALNSSTGSLLWEFNASGAESGFLTMELSVQSFAVNNGTVYVGGEHDGVIYAFDAKNGEKKWETELPHPSIVPEMVPIGWISGKPNNATNLCSPALLEDVVYVYGEHLICVKAFNPEGGWGYNKYLIGAVHALNATDGVLLWSHITSSYDSQGSGHIVAGNGVVYASSYLFYSSKPWIIDLGLYALNATNGEVVWEYRIIDHGDHGDTGYFTLSDNVVYLPYYKYIRNMTYNEGSIVALNASTGAKLWEVSLGANTVKYMAKAGDVIYLSMPSGRLAAFNTETKQLTWSCTVGSSISPPVIAANKLFVTSPFTIFCLGEGVNPVRIKWTERTSMPTARDFMFRGQSVIGDRIYVVGGWSSVHQTALNTVEIYDVSQDVWTIETSLPQPRLDGAVQVVNGKLYVIGGNSQRGGGAVSTVWEYNPISRVWASKAPMPTGRVSLASAVVDGIIYTISGVDGSNSFSNAVEAYDPVSNTWTRKSPHPLPRRYLTAETVNGKIYTLGGSGILGDSDKVHMYDPISDTWTEKSRMPILVCTPNSVAVDGKILVVGGDYSHIVMMYDPKSDAWTSILSDDLPTPRSLGLTAEVNGRIYVIGGDGTDKNEEGFLVLFPPFAPDRVNILLYTDRSRVDVGSNASINHYAIYGNFEGDFLGSVVMNDTNLKQNVVGKRGYAVAGIVDDERGWTALTTNEVAIIWDNVNLTLEVSNNRIGIGSTVNIAWTGFYEYDGKAFFGSVSYNDTLTKNTVGKYGYAVATITDLLYGLTAFITNEVYCIFDRIRPEVSFETFTLGSVQVTVNLRFDYDSSPVDDAVVRVNNIVTENVGNGMYRTILHTWMPYSIINIKVEKAGFEPTTMETVIYSLGNTILEASSITIFSVFTVFGLNAIRVQKKRRYMNLKKLEELVSGKGRIGVGEASEATGVDIANIKALFSDLIKKTPSLQGFFINNDREFVLESVLINSMNKMGNFDFEELSISLGIAIDQAREIFSKLYREGKIRGTFTLDGKIFITEEKLKEEIMRSIR